MSGGVDQRGSTASGIMFMLAGVVAIVALDTVAKWLLATYTLWQLVLLRSAFSIAVIFGYTVAQGRLDELRTERPGWHVLRSLLMAASTFAFFYGLKYLPLADILTLAFVAPLIVTALSRPMLGEHVGPWRWGAVVVGFCGVLAVLRPGSGLMHPAALVVLGGAATYALVSLTARKLRTTETTAALSLYMFGVPLLMGIAGAGPGWIAPDLVDWLLFALCGISGGLAFVFFNAAFRRAPAAVLVPFEYTGLIWAAAAGYTIWNEVPGANTWIGAAIIIASGLFILYRETLMQRGQPRTDFPLQDAVALERDD